MQSDYGCLYDGESPANWGLQLSPIWSWPAAGEAGSNTESTQSEEDYGRT